MLGMSHPRREPPGGPHASQILKYFYARSDLLPFLFFRQENQLDIFGIAMAHYLMPFGMERLHRLWVSDCGQAVDVEGSLQPVLSQYPEDPPKSGPSPIVVFASGSKIVLASYLLRGNGIRTSHMPGPAQLRVRHFGPGLQIACQSDGKPGPVGPLDFYFFPFGKNVVERIVCRDHAYSLL